METTLHTFRAEPSGKVGRYSQPDSHNARHDQTVEPFTFGAYVAFSGDDIIASGGWNNTDNPKQVVRVTAHRESSGGLLEQRANFTFPGSAEVGEAVVQHLHLRFPDCWIRATDESGLNTIWSTRRRNDLREEAFRAGHDDVESGQGYFPPTETDLRAAYDSGRRAATTWR